MNKVRLDGAAIGNHDFDYGFSYLSEFLKGRKAPSLLSNVENKNGEKYVFPRQKLSKLFTLNNGIKIGAIGLTTIATPERSSGWALNDEKLKNLKFQSYSSIIQE